MNYKTCSKCEIEKDETNYWKDKYHKNGLTSVCKKCFQEYRHVKEVVINRRKWFNTYIKKELPRKKKKDQKSKYEHKYKDKKHAWNVYHYARRTGKIVPSSTCEVCNADCNIPLHAHHSDYSKPLQVQWLCYICHNKIHNHYVQT